MLRDQVRLQVLFLFVLFQIWSFRIHIKHLQLLIWLFSYKPIMKTLPW